MKLLVYINTNSNKIIIPDGPWGNVRWKERRVLIFEIGKRLLYKTGDEKAKNCQVHN